MKQQLENLAPFDMNKWIPINQDNLVFYRSKKVIIFDPNDPDKIYWGVINDVKESTITVWDTTIVKKFLFNGSRILNEWGDWYEDAEILLAEAEEARDKELTRALDTVLKTNTSYTKIIEIDPSKWILEA